ncbi:hypothetical protein BCR34DRAFT_107389 [Clohesyomyces aquaticus]|uniref:BTB/POZ domain-containing protein n=1 Tax=Clohesyomyces aquaticus TaxID=1231657 RepID=A0A1Y2A1U7_9PLEO|nr:hypothetical protein BCR34DRAFT_107389 [Clohesyomyces aquaticus]
MPDPSGHASSRDFAFQSTDQAFAHGIGGAASSYPAHDHERYNAKRDTNAASAPPPNNHAPQQANSALAFPDFPHDHHSLQSQAPNHFAQFGYSPVGGPLVWDWNNSSIDFSDFPNHFEPQGELVQELQNQTVPTNDFSIPQPVTAAEAIFQSPQKTPSIHTAIQQNPLSPPPPPNRPAQRPAVLTGMKRKAESEPNSAVSQPASVSADTQPPPAKRANKSRSSSQASITSPAVATVSEGRPSPMAKTTTAVAAPEPAPPANSSTTPELQRSKGTGPQGRVIDVSKPRKVVESPGDILPAGKVFPIQIGSELFRLSGASLSSDAPSYFSHFFGEQLLHNNGSTRASDLRTLYIDRDPDTFRDIALHLQGYHVKPRDGEHFVRLFADAQFYSLPRLTKQLFSTDIFIRIGDIPFQIPRDLFSSPGDSPNYFSLGFAHFFTTPSEVFPGLDRNALLRPPSILPPAVPSRSGETFRELIKVLQGYDIEIRNEEHRAELLRDARYFHLKGLEQKLIPCDISYNLKHGRSEILIRLEDIRQSGVSFTPDTHSSPPNSSISGSTALSPAPNSKPPSPSPSLHSTSHHPHPRSGTVSYARPYTDDHANTHILILEIGAQESTSLHFPAYPPTHASSSSNPNPLTLNLRATFHGQTLARITSLFSVIASKMGLPATQPLGLMMMASGGGVAAQPVSPANSGVSERRVRVRWGENCDVEMDGQRVELGVDKESGRIGVRRITSPSSVDNSGAGEEEGAWLWGGAKPDLAGADEGETEWVVKRAHWRIRVEHVSDGEGSGAGGRMQVVMCGVKIQGFSVERSRNRGRGFLSA